MISVVVPTRNSSKDLKDCLESLAQNKKHEMIAVFDSKDDKNIPLARKHAKIVFDPYHSIGGAYFTGTNAAKGNIIAFTDDDCVLPKDWISKIEQQFKNGGIDVLGGEDVLPENSPFFQRAAYQIDKSRRMKHAVTGEKAKNRLRAANISYAAGVFKKENFNTKLKGLQEPEFHHRLFNQGYRMKFDPNLEVYHKRRNSLKSIFHQIYRNGKAKAALLKMHPDTITPYDAIIMAGPVVLALVLVFGPAKLMGYPTWQALLGLVVAYFAAKPLVYTRLTGLKYYFHLIAIVFVREMAYALGLFGGLLTINKS